MSLTTGRISNHFLSLLACAPKPRHRLKMPGIPSAFLPEILSRLPAEDLLRLKCVCKPWAYLINSRDFVKLHLKRSITSRNNRSLIISSSGLFSVNLETNRATELDLPLKSSDSESYLNLLGTCDGLLCFMLCFTYTNEKYDIVIWNMTTREYRKLPAVSRSPFPELEHFVVHGFGHDYVRDDYKLVRIVRFYPTCDYLNNEVKVYSLRDNSWSTVESCPHYLIDKGISGVHVNGALHWVVSREPDFEAECLVIAFDLSTEDYREVALPKFRDRDKEFLMSIGLLEGQLCLLLNYVASRVDLWVMADYGNTRSWSKLVSLGKLQVISYFGFVMPLAMSESNSKILLNRDGRKFSWYDIEKKEVRDVVIRGVQTELTSQWEICLSSVVKLSDNGSLQVSKRKNRKKKNKRMKGGTNRRLSSVMISHILCRLPVKTLLRFKCVSKSWCSMIMSTNFINLHLDYSMSTRDNVSLILRDSYLYSVDLEAVDHAYELDYPLKSSSYNTHVVGSCNGLLCLTNGEDIVIWNMATKNHCNVPIPSVELPSYRPSQQFITYGLGYDSTTDDYKLVRVVQFYGRHCDSYDSEVKIYSMKENAWRRSSKFPYYLKYNRGWGVFVDRALHWVVSRKPQSDTESFIVAFDLRNEDYDVVTLPYLKNGHEKLYMNIGRLDCNLCLACNYPRDRVDVWVMLEYGEEHTWYNFFSVRQPEIIGRFDYMLPVTMSKTGWEVLLDIDGKKHLWYDIEEKVKDAGIPSLFEAHVYVASLVQPGVLSAFKSMDDSERRVASHMAVNMDVGQSGRINQQAAEKKRTKKRDDFLSTGFKLVL